MKWFRFYSDALDDPKVQRLPGDLFKTWVNLLCLAAKDDGCLPSTEDIAFALRLSDEQAASAIAEFTKRGLLDSGEDGMTPHNWQGRQPVSDRDPTATERQQRRRSRIASEGVTDTSRVTTATVTPLDKIRLEEIREEKKEIPAPSAAVPETITNISELTEERPQEMVAAFCASIGADVRTQAPAWVGKQRAVAKRMLEQGYTIEKVVACAGFRQSQTWRDEPFDLFDIERGIGKWEAAGSPPRAKGRASPSGRGPITASDTFLVNGKEPDDEQRKRYDEADRLAFERAKQRAAAEARL